MRRILLVFLLMSLLPASIAMMQEDLEAPRPRLEITGIDPSDSPDVQISANIFSSSGQPIRDLQASNFVLDGELAEVATVTDVQNITNDDLPISAVLVIDTSSSMSGGPILAAQEAARVFVNSLREGDSVAIIQFDTDVRLVQDYTTDRDVLQQAIDTLSFGGQTALYEASTFSVEVAEEAPSSRRSVILLSDGADFGDVSDNVRGDALEMARATGVPIYTIGIGFGTDRTYLRELAEGTSARNYEFPSTDELTSIYEQLAEILRSQYIISLDLEAPLDGTTYDFTVQADTAQGVTNVATGSLTTPIPVPIIAVTGIPAEPISEPTTATLDIRADDPLTEVTATIADSEMVVLSEEPYTVSIDPVDFIPGTYNLTVTATDVDDDRATTTTSFEIAALPSEVDINPDLTGLNLTEETPVSVITAGQTTAERVVVSLGEEMFVLTEEPFEFTIDPMLLPTGEQTLVIDVTNTAGITSTFSQTINVAIPTIYVGSKSFPEAEILSWIVYLVMEDEGLRVVEDMQTAPTTAEVRQALLDGTIDVYVEYTATGVLLLAENNPSISPEDAKDYGVAFSTVSIFDSTRNDLIWLQPSPANNTYALAVTDEFATENEIETLEDLALYINAGNEVVIVGNTEFFERADAYQSFETTYGWQATDDQIYNMGEEAQPTETLTALETGDNGTNVAMAYTTDGELITGDFVVLEDSLGAQPFYAPAPVVRGEVIRNYPNIAVRLQRVFQELDNRALQNLNLAVTRFGDTPEEAAADFLIEIGEIEADEEE